MNSFEPPIPEDLKFAIGTVSRMLREQGKSTKEVRAAIQASATIFIHYIIDYAAEQHQRGDDERPVAIKPMDIVRALNELGFSNIARKVVSK